MAKHLIPDHITILALNTHDNDRNINLKPDVTH